MRVFVAGIRIAKEHENSSLADKVAYVTALLATINADAKRKSADDEDVLVFVVMCEYALTSLRAESHAELSIAMQVLADAVKSYGNMILIPGTCASYEDLLEDESVAGQERRRSESQILLRNYESITSDPDLSRRYMVDKAIKDLGKKLEHESDISKYLFLRNAAYIMTPMSQVIRHTSVPYFEYKKMPNQEPESIFYIGNSNPLVTITTNKGEMNLGVLICVEQLMLKLPHGATQKDVPVFQVVVSDTVDMDHNNLFAALTIQMDSKAGLNGLKVVMNYNHCYADQIDHVDCFHYDSTNLHEYSDQAGMSSFGGKEMNADQLDAMTAPKPVASEPAFVRASRNRKARFNLSMLVNDHQAQEWPCRQSSDNDLSAAAPESGRSINNSNNI